MYAITSDNCGWVDRTYAIPAVLHEAWECYLLSRMRFDWLIELIFSVWLCFKMLVCTQPSAIHADVPSLMLHRRFTPWETIQPYHIHSNYVVHVVIISNPFAAGILHKPMALSGYIKRRVSNGNLVPILGTYAVVRPETFNSSLVSDLKN